MTTEVEERRIRLLVTELANATPPAPSLAELDLRIDRVAPHSRNSPGGRVRRRRVVSLAGAGCAAVVALLFAVLLPGRNEQYPAAAAAQLHEIATNAAAQPQVTLNRGQWLATTADLSLQASVTRGVDPLAVPAQASIDGKVAIWVNGFGQVCTSTNLGGASFPSAESEQAWHALGLLDTPPNQPVNGCTEYIGGSILDDSQLSTNPAVLVRQIEALQAPGDFGARKNIDEVANILLGPATGSSPALISAIYGALSLMPDIHALGMVATHSGTSGLGYASQSSSGVTTIVVNPNTGALLEVRGLPYIRALSNFVQSLAPSYIGPNSDLVNQQPSLASSISWLDPTATSQVVSTGSLPSGMVPAQDPTAEIVVALTPAANDGPGLNRIVPNVQTLFDSIVARSGGNLVKRGGGYGDGYSTVDFYLAGPSSALNGIVQQFRSSNLVASVEVDTGHGLGQAGG